MEPPVLPPAGVPLAAAAAGSGRPRRIRQPPLGIYEPPGLNTAPPLALRSTPYFIATDLPPSVPSVSAAGEPDPPPGDPDPLSGGPDPCLPAPCVSASLECGRLALSLLLLACQAWVNSKARAQAVDGFMVVWVWESLGESYATSCGFRGRGWPWPTLTPWRRRRNQSTPTYITMHLWVKIQFGSAKRATASPY
ncbi:hypothetical protein U9M48_040342 [Paspalum notatum var. saurae]|uniref:Uncharacterized protein n=1 Tax=Paspalum notatum var. saurae TaxID=547442 RepID=A0AAQ3ULJ2_PASNO